MSTLGDEGSMSSLETLMQRWWSFPALIDDPEWGETFSLRKAEASDARLPRMSVPFLSQLISSMPTEKSQGGDKQRASSGRTETREVVRDSLLDTYLLDGSTPQDLRGFVRLLDKPRSTLVATFSSGKSIRGSLADLCSLRLGGIISRRPSPVFYDENYPQELNQENPNSNSVLSPAYLLPTENGRILRQQVLANPQGVTVPLFLYFTAGNFLPEVHGYMPAVSMEPTEWSRKVARLQPRQSDSPEPTSQLQAKDPVRRALPETIRFALLLAVAVHKSIRKDSMKSQPIPKASVARLGQPWRGNSFLTRRDNRLFKTSEVDFGNESLR